MIIDNFTHHILDNKVSFLHAGRHERVILKRKAATPESQLVLVLVRNGLKHNFWRAGTRVVILESHATSWHYLTDTVLKTSNCITYILQDPLSRPDTCDLWNKPLFLSNLMKEICTFFHNDQNSRELVSAWRFYCHDDLQDVGNIWLRRSWACQLCNCLCLKDVSDASIEKECSFCTRAPISGFLSSVSLSLLQLIFCYHFPVSVSLDLRNQTQVPLFSFSIQFLKARSEHCDVESSSRLQSHKCAVIVCKFRISGSKKILSDSSSSSLNPVRHDTT